jgi:hypothetical protein
MLRSLVPGWGHFALFFKVMTFVVTDLISNDVNVWLRLLNTTITLMELSRLLANVCHCPA